MKLFWQAAVVLGLFSACVNSEPVQSEIKETSNQCLERVNRNMVREYQECMNRDFIFERCILTEEEVCDRLRSECGTCYFR